MNLHSGISVEVYDRLQPGPVVPGQSVQVKSGKARRLKTAGIVMLMKREIFS